MTAARIFSRAFASRTLENLSQSFLEIIEQFTGSNEADFACDFPEKSISIAFVADATGGTRTSFPPRALNDCAGPFPLASCSRMKADGLVPAFVSRGRPLSIARLSDGRACERNVLNIGRNYANAGLFHLREEFGSREIQMMPDRIGSTDAVP
jgi:hypothetical protein